MAHKFAEIAFTQDVRDVQAEMGGRRAYQDLDGEGPDRSNEIGENEAAFIESRTSFYMATVSTSGWPYIQHRGGHPGFIRALDAKTLGFIDYRGNRQYVSVGNLRGDDRVSLFFIDYPERARLKLLGRAKVVSLEDAAARGLSIAEGYRAQGERALIVSVDAIDWNCPQHIAERVTLDDVRAVVAKLQQRIAGLEDENKALRAHLGAPPMER